MCEACESDEPFEPREPVPPEILTAARVIEAALVGERAPDQAWAIYLGRAGGALAWPHYQRIRASFEGAYTSAPRVRMKAPPAASCPPLRGRRLSYEVGVVR